MYTFDFSQIEFFDIRKNRIQALRLTPGGPESLIRELVGEELFKTASNPFIHNLACAIYNGEPLEVQEDKIEVVKSVIAQKGFAYFISGPILDYIDSLGKAKE